MLIINSAFAQSSDSFTPLEFQLLNQVDQMIEQPQYVVWPGLNMAQTPIVLIFPNQKIVAFHLKTDNPEWHVVDPQRPYILLTKNDRWKISEIMLHPAFSIEGQKVFVFNLAKGEGNEPIPIMAHEWFHRYQMDKFRPETVIARQYRDQLNLTNLVLMRLEEVILLKFLQAKEDRIECIKDFVAVNYIRKQIIHPESWAWETHEQKMEGLADFISMRMFHREQNLINSLEQADDKSLIEKAIKWRHYDVGAAMGIALDEIKAKDWKLEVEKNGKNQAELLHEFLPVEEDLFTRFELIKCRYPFHEIESTISAHLDAYNGEISHWMANYDSTAGLVVKLSAPRHLGISGGGDSVHIFTLGDGTIFSIQDQSRSTTTDNFWKLETKKVPVFFQNKQGYREFKVEKEAKISIDGEQYAAKDLEAKRQDFVFQELSFQGQQISFSSQHHHGVLLIHGGVITVKYL